MATGLFKLQMLNKCFRYLDRIIRGSELQEFATLLKDHQKATMTDGK